MSTVQNRPSWKTHLDANPTIQIDPRTHQHTPLQPQPSLSAASVYTEWVYFAVPGMTAKPNLYGLDYGIKFMPPGGAVIEIGAFCGLSTCMIAHFLQKHGKGIAAAPVSPTRPDGHRFITCDKWLFEGAPQDKPIGFDTTKILHSEYRQFVKNSFLRNVGFFTAPDVPHAVECFSDEFFELWKKKAMVIDVTGRPLQLGGPISFAYVDGHHGYDYAKRDWLNVDEFLLPGGFIMFDDSADHSGWEVNKVMHEIAKDPRYTIVVKNPHYLVRKND